MTIRDALREGIEKLKAAGIEAPVNEAGVMLCHVLNCDKVGVYAHGEAELGEEEYCRYSALLIKRAGGMPVQYITGHQEFMSLDFIVNPSVLIPRRDTEILVETVIRLSNQFKDIEPNILDIGTGSGCIAVSLAHYIKKCRVTAVDISGQALEIARINAEQNGVSDKIGFLMSDLFSALSPDEYGSLYDIIVSNPPYIVDSDIFFLQEEVKGYEPLTALSGGKDGLDFYRKIIGCAGSYLGAEGILAFEVGYNQAAAVASLMRGQYSGINIVKDLSQIDRVVYGYKS